MRRSLLLALLAALLIGTSAAAQTADDPFRTFFVGRVQYSQNDGRDCGDVGRAMAQLVAQVSTVPVRGERQVSLRGDAIFETPFLFMNGHNDFVLTDAEIANLRKYLAHGGFFFASGCCTNPKFPIAWRREFSRIFSIARMGSTGEAYAFDARGLMLTVSRFDAELKQQGLIPNTAEATAILHVRLLDGKRTGMASTNHTDLAGLDGFERFFVFRQGVVNA